MEQMNFGVTSRNRIRGCLSSSKASVLVNGTPTEEFSNFKGVKQGDPLSPFLFVLAMEGLNLAINTAKQKSLFHDIELLNSPLLSHLFMQMIQYLLVIGTTVASIISPQF